jgi:hypothetical protein
LLKDGSIKFLETLEMASPPFLSSPGNGSGPCGDTAAGLNPGFEFSPAAVSLPLFKHMHWTIHRRFSRALALAMNHRWPAAFDTKFLAFCLNSASHLSNHFLSSY